MFAYRRFSKDEKQVIGRFLTAIPEITNSSKDPPEYENMVTKIEEDLFSELSQIFSFFEVIHEESAWIYQDVFAVRIFAGKNEDFYTVFGYEVFIRKDRNGKRWYTFSPTGRKYYLKGSEDGKIPALNLKYSGCCGDVNTLTHVDCEEIIYLTTD